jgi:hypothetical protein
MKRNGIAIILSPEIKYIITQIDYISCRITKIKILLKGKETKINQTCALQVGCQDDEKDAFIEELEEVLCGEYTIIVGNLMHKLVES